MQTSATVVEISKALAKAQPEFRAVAKSGENKAQGYKFADLDDYLAASRKGLESHGLSLAFSVEEAIDLPPRTTKSGAILYGLRVRVVARLLHISGEWLEAQAFGEGTDSGDKACYKAITGARKYATAALLGLATGDDPERDDRQERASRKPAAKSDGGNGAAGAEPPTEDQLNRLEGWLLDERLPSKTRDYIGAQMAGGLTKGAAGALIGKVKEKFAKELGAGKAEPGANG